MAKIKVLRIIARLNIGGPAIHTVLLTEGLNNDKFESLLVCGSIDKDEGDMLYYALQKNINPIFIPELKRKISLVQDIIALKKIYKIIKSARPDIIHTHTAKAGTLGRIAALLYNFFSFEKKRRIKLVHTFHGHIFEGYFNTFQNKVFILIERFLGYFTERIITVSDSLRRELISLGICNEKKIEVVPLGLELDKFLSVPEKNSPSLNIGIVGRLVPIKNHRLFLESAAILIKDNPGMNLRFKIIGDGELRGDLEAYARFLGISAKVDFSGWQRDLPSVYADLDIVALTSLNEGTPVSIIEAMASGRAVVATDLAGVSDLLGKEMDNGAKAVAVFKVAERGIIVKSNNSSDFSKAIFLSAQNNELRQMLARSARNFVKTMYGKERLLTDIEELYMKILGRLC